MLKLKTHSDFHDLFLSILIILLIVTSESILYRTFLLLTYFIYFYRYSFNIEEKKYFKAEDESIRGEVRLIGNLLNIMLKIYRLLEFGSINCVRHIPQA
jgi:hypothetical protein